MSDEQKETRYNKWMAVVGSLIIVIIAVAAVLVWLKRPDQRIALWEYVPSEALIYAEFDLTNKNLKDYFFHHPVQEKNLKTWFIRQGLAEGIWQTDMEIENIAVMSFFASSGAEQMRAWLIRVEGDVRRLEMSGFNGYYFMVMDKQTAVVTKDKAVEKIIRSGNAVNYQAMELGARDVNMGGWLRGYYRLDKSDLLGDIFGELQSGSKELGEVSIFFSGGIADGQMNFWAETPGMDENNFSSAEIGERVGFFKIPRVIQVNGLSAQVLFAGLASNYEKEMGLDNAERAEKYIQNKYGIKISELYTFFKHPVFLIARPNFQFDNMADWLEDNNYSYALMFKIDEQGEAEFLEKLEMAMRNYLAFSFPIEKEKILPDGSSGMEIAADPARVQFFSFGNADSAIRYVEDNGFEMAYHNLDGWLTIGNSKEFVAELIDAKKWEENETHFIDFDIAFDPKIMGELNWGLDGYVFVKSDKKASRAGLSAWVIE